MDRFTFARAGTGYDIIDQHAERGAQYIAHSKRVGDARMIVKALNGTALHKMTIRALRATQRKLGQVQRKLDAKTTRKEKK